MATLRDGDLVVAALLAVNATGDIDDGTMTAGRGRPRLAAAQRGGVPRRRHAGLADRGPANDDMTNTTIGVVATNARLDKNACLVVAQGGHDGMARALFPPHTSADGDALIVAATQQVDADLDLVRALAVVVVERAIRSLGGDAGHR